MIKAYALLFLPIMAHLVNGQELPTKLCDEQHWCLNGGTCMAGTSNSGETVQVCSCKDAVDLDGNRYTGLYCEHEVPKAESMEEMSNDPRICDANGGFCLNGGTCLDSGTSICECPNKWTGANCEIRKNHNTIKQLSDGSMECDMQCQNGGGCQFGIKQEYQDEIDAYSPGLASINGDSFYQHCQCNEGFTGKNCEKYQASCGDDEEGPGNYCQHGGTCVDLFLDGFLTYDKRFTCDCSTVNERYSNVAFAGNYCEVMATSICAEEVYDFNGKQFCTNYGTCVSLGNDLFSCNCPKGYSGAHCEYGLGSEGPPVPTEDHCTQTICQNGGVCKYGKKDHGLLSEMMAKPVAAASLKHLFPDNANEYYEHCVCPEGYAGTLCEHKAEVCGQREHLLVCFHGSQCVKDGDEDSCSCNARTNVKISDNMIDDDGLGDDEVDGRVFHQGQDGKEVIDDDEDRRSLASIGGKNALGGKYCQYKATSRCGNTHSCFNNGICRSDNMCTCVNGFKGRYCEYPKETIVIAGKKTNKGSLIFLFCALIFWALSVIFLLSAMGSEDDSKEYEIHDEELKKQMMQKLAAGEPSSQNANTSSNNNNVKNMNDERIANENISMTSEEEMAVAQLI